MKRLFMLLCAVVAFAACEQAPIKEMQGAAINERNLEVSFEGGDDTRIQLQNGKTVWTKGDHVSVFYRSTVNEEWQFTGETGDRTGQIVPVDNTLNPPVTHNRVVVIYPYNKEYYLNTETYSIEASLPAVQNYLENSYGTNGNIMVSSGDYKQVSLKSVCGWLKLQLTGDGEVVKSITFKGNDGEQVAGELYINTSDATCVLASASGDAGESEVGGSLVRPGTILTEVTLDCGEGVALGKEATAFYIALPPQTFEKGFTVDIECDGYKPMTLSTTNTLTIKRNHIQPMAGVEHNAIPVVPNNQIWYTSSDGKVVTPYNTNNFGANITSNKYNNGKGVITFDGDVTTIGDDTFRNCDSLTSVTIGDSVTTIGELAFNSCDSLTSVTIGDSVTRIGYGAFAYCTSLTSVTIGDSVTEIGNFAFAYCRSLTSVNIPDSVTTIGVSAFDFCTSLTSVTIGDSVMTIADYAFGDCTSLTSVTIGDSVTTIADYAFGDCTSLTSVYISDISAWCNISFGDQYSNPLSNGCNLYLNNELVTDLTIPDSVTSIGEYAFYSCDSLTSVNIPDSVTTIGEYAFCSCYSLTSVTIGDSVTTIGNFVFGDCNSLTSVTIGNSVTTIRSYAFEGCTSLTSVNIPDSVTEIGYIAFARCDSLQEFTGKFATEDGRSLIMDNTIIAYANASGNTYTIPDSVTTIRNGAFRDCTSLTSVNIPDSVTTIGHSAFERCYSLTSVYCKATTPPSLSGSSVFDNNGSGRKIYVPAGSVNAYKSAEYWNEYASDIVGYDFENGVVVSTPQNNEIWYTSSDGNVVTPNKTNVFGANISSNTYSNGKGVITFDGDVTTIGYYAFDNCTNLTSVTICDSVTTIGQGAFDGCTSLTSVNIPDSVTEIGYAAFAYCNSLKEFTGKIAEDNGRIVVVDGSLIAFAPAGITEYTIPNSVTSIGYAAFAYCDSLTSVNIPDSVTEIGAGAFYDCDSLKSVYCKAATPPALGGNSVFDDNASGRKIYVPAGSASAYRSATRWNEYASAIVGYNF